jgi:hypothetical protein
MPLLRRNTLSSEPITKKAQAHRHLQLRTSLHGKALRTGRPTEVDMGNVKWLLAAGLIAATTAACTTDQGYYPNTSYNSGYYGNSGYYAPTSSGYYAPRSSSYYAPSSSYYAPSSSSTYYAPRSATYTPRRGPNGDYDRDGIPNRYDRDANGDGVPDRYQR